MYATFNLIEIIRNKFSEKTAEQTDIECFDKKNTHEIHMLLFLYVVLTEVKVFCDKRACEHLDFKRILEKESDCMCRTE